jgi:AcrR family transcriptional regulator
MAERKRAYASDLRAEQARRTRRQIVAAGGRLFAEQGYAVTTVDAIALAAGVSRKTVFTAVGGKSVILKLAHDWAIVGDDEPVGLEERASLQAMRAMTDPVGLLEKYVDHLVVTHERLAPIHCAMRNAADADPEAAALFEETKQQRLTGMGHFAAHLEELGLRPGLSRRRATDLLFHLIDPSHYQTLVIERGWSLAAYRGFLLASLKLHLLGIAEPA